MSLVACRECNQQVSDQARTCPHCGIACPGGAPNKNIPVLRASNGLSLTAMLALLLVFGYVASAVGGHPLLLISAFCYVIFCIGIYFLPTFIASDREHPSRLSIFVINLFFGWTILGWVACLAWSLSGNND